MSADAIEAAAPDGGVFGISGASAAVAEVKRTLRIDGTAEDALLAVLAGSATTLCEAFTGLTLVARGFEEVVRAEHGGAIVGWSRLGRSPVRAITGPAPIDGSGTAIVPGVGDYSSDIDADGYGWIRPSAFGGGHFATWRPMDLRISYEAGLATDWSGVPDPLRHGIVRLAGHLYVHRDGGDERDPPASVAALWRPFRRMQFGRACPAVFR